MSKIFTTMFLGKSFAGNIDDQHEAARSFAKTTGLDVKYEFNGVLVTVNENTETKTCPLVLKAVAAGKKFLDLRGRYDSYIENGGQFKLCGLQQTV